MTEHTDGRDTNTNTMITTMIRLPRPGLGRYWIQVRTTHSRMINLIGIQYTALLARRLSAQRLLVHRTISTHWFFKMNSRITGGWIPRMKPREMDCKPATQVFFTLKSGIVLSFEPRCRCKQFRSPLLPAKSTKTLS